MSGFSNREEYILPILVPPGEIAEEILDNNERFKIIWDVLQAMRAHEDRLDVIVNKFTIVGVTIDDDSPVKQPGEEPPNLKDTQAAVTQYLFSFPVEELKDALYAKIVKKCGDRKTLIQWAKDVADIATRHIAQIKEILDFPIYRESFNKFRDGLRQDLNPDITDDEVIDMLSQHLITEPVFNALFGGSAFAKENPVSQSLNAMIDTLKKAGFDGEIQKLEKFYKRVEMQASGDRTAEGKQKFVLELYDNFFKVAFPRMAERLGIVYTPVEVVDWIVKAVDQALRQEFGKGITDKDIHVLDPFTGTGTFLVRLIQSGLIAPKDLKRKYHHELHANELVLLAYYIAAINIEEAYHEQSRNLQSPQRKQGIDDYEPFEGIVLTDTFRLLEKEFAEMSASENSQRARRQKKTPITVIIGNPPYSVGQKSENDANKNVKYEQLDEKIRTTYADTGNAVNQRNLYDSYIRAFRWASDRIGECGIVCYVSNGGWIDKNAMDGFRKCLADEFTDIYVFNLRGGIRGKQGDSAKREGQNVFPIMTQIAITLLIKNPARVQSASQRDAMSITPGVSRGNTPLPTSDSPNGALQSRESCAPLGLDPSEDAALRRLTPAVIDIPLLQSEAQSSDCGSEAEIHYYDIGDYLSREEKLKILADADGLQNIAWQIIEPNEKNDWINQRGDEFDSFISLVPCVILYLG